MEFKAMFNTFSRQTESLADRVARLEMALLHAADDIENITALTERTDKIADKYRAIAADFNNVI